MFNIAYLEMIASTRVDYYQRLVCQINLKFFALETGLRPQEGLSTIVPVTINNLTPINDRTKEIYQLSS
ncbi:hypothetical protein [uncultured Shewanella sp.]|uniref:hypothetical protein n=1 Tax=uncultured Shewanella sp. TaxID=173975 RepID=UPI002622B78C|nr:hypothetical protein [uncultured Shewanella sp.]